MSNLTTVPTEQLTEELGLRKQVARREVNLTKAKSRFQELSTSGVEELRTSLNSTTDVAEVARLCSSFYSSYNNVKNRIAFLESLVNGA